ncbi:Antibiotic biosynthesis monooxygenase (ABM) superfamily enzyme [Paracoccus halophilus]|uniref:Antibiotic biosynthesis monooxygenase (ABM) superfamily enzyme n=1 Tax=Paracoccus halophilus TaxID=376733 RepID=A0A099F403_9RHOB|nr:hypothetical protein [Paracoccus halophilus]KGJ05134.1 hypothetical protein IT41_07025 [Paracoccus halophilus]SFA43939.1 Antibiotic biosynthesis monooxygenase (ABM) superfamily enzyme [Paracoccus halophilus]
MPQDTRPVLSVAVRRFDRNFEQHIRKSLRQLQEAAAEQPGYLGEQNSVSHVEDHCELVTVFAFDSQTNLDNWENSELRNRLIAEIDRHPHESTKHTGFDDFSVLLHPQSKVTRIEIVLVLIFWIILLSGVLNRIADFVLPDSFPPALRYVLTISVNVGLISYIFLPWSSRMLTRLRDRLESLRRDR